MPQNKWFIKLFSEYACREAYYAYATTDSPCHLWLRWTYSRPRRHRKARTFRGLTTMADVYFCVTSFHEVEQEEAGDTITHTFIVTPLKACKTFYFYFHGEIAALASPSTSPVFGRHLFSNPYLYETTITHENDVAIAWAGLIWSNPPSAPAFCYTGNSQGAGRPQGGALRFRDVALPHCAEIIEATLYLQAWGNTDKVPILSQLSVEGRANPASFYDIDDVIFWSRWATRQQVINWDNIPPWTHGTWYSAPDISALIQYALNLPLWVPGNAIVIYWDDFLQRTAQGFAKFRVSKLYVAGLPGIPVLIIKYNYWQVVEISIW